MRYERTYTKGKGTFSALSHREFCWKQVQRIRQWSQCFLKLNWITRAERQKDLSKRQVNAWLPKPWAGKAWGQQRLGPTSRLPEHLFAHFMCSGMARTERIFVMSMPSNLWLCNSCHFDDVAFSLQLDSIYPKGYCPLEIWMRHSRVSLEMIKSISMGYQDRLIPRRV